MKPLMLIKLSSYIVFNKRKNNESPKFKIGDNVRVLLLLFLGGRGRDGEAMS